jgi:uncharacterized membrane protein
MFLSDRTRRILAITAFVVPALLHLLIVVLNHYFHRTFAYYYGVYNFTFWDYGHLQSSPIPVLFDGTNSTFLQDHFSLLFILLAPLYWVTAAITGTYTLLLIQWLAIIAGGAYTYKLIAEKYHQWGTAMAAMLCYFFYYAKFSAYMADCNLAIIGSSLIPVFFYYFELQKQRGLYIIFLLLLIIREDFSLWLFFVGIFLMIVHRKNPLKLKSAAFITLASILFFMLLFSWIIPSLESETKKFALFNYGALGEGPGAALLFILQHPIKSIELLVVNHIGAPEWDGEKLKFYLMFGLSGGLLLFLRPAYLICLIPLIAKKMYNDDPFRWGYESYYGIEVACILPVLLFSLVAEQKWMRPRLLASMVFVAGMLGSIYGFRDFQNVHVFNKIEFYTKDFYRRDYPIELKKILQSIPSDAAVSASSRLLPHLAYRQKIYFFPMIKDAEYVCLSVYGDTWPASVEEYEAKIAELRAQGWQDFYSNGNALILKKPRVLMAKTP